MNDSSSDLQVREILGRLAVANNLCVQGGKIRRTSSRFCLGVEHGDYNGTDNANECILGTGTNLINGANGITSFSGFVMSGAGSTLHLTGSAAGAAGELRRSGKR